MIGTLLGFLAMFGFGAIYYGLLTAEAGAEMAANFASCMNAEPNMAFVHSWGQRDGRLSAGLHVRQNGGQ